MPPSVQLDSFKSVEHLEEQMATPSPRDQEVIRRLEGDFIILGAGGKMGPSLARRIKRTANALGLRRKVIAVSRFSSAASFSRSMYSSISPAILLKFSASSLISEAPRTGERW